MPTTDETLADGLARWLARHLGVSRVVVDELERPSAGYASFTLLFRARTEEATPRTLHLVLRMGPSPAGLFADYDLVAQHAAQGAAAAAGVPVATPIVESDPAWLGAPFMLMPRVDGHILGEVTVLDPWLSALSPGERAELHEHFVAALGRIHAAPTEIAAAGGVPVRDEHAEFTYWEEYLQWSSGGAPVPTIAGALRWCREHAPHHREPGSLCWGDVRLGNVVFGDDRRPLAVLDWDMASIGARAHDVAWYTTLTATMTTLLGRSVDGFPDRDGTIAQYEQLTGCALPDLEWYETFALVRSTAIMTRIGYLAIAAGERPTMPIDDNPLLDILRDRTGAT